MDSRYKPVVDEDNTPSPTTERPGSLTDTKALRYCSITTEFKRGVMKQLVYR